MTAGGVLAVFAHPDDESLLAGGTLAACAGAGVDVGALSLTRGELGEIADPALATRDDLGAVRAGELAAAGRALGASWTECLDFPDGSLEWAPADEVREAVAQRISDHRPRAVITFAPEGLYWHPDHLATHRLTVEAVAGASEPLWLYGATWPAGLAERLVSEVRALGLAVDLWGLDPAAFGAEEESITTVLDVRPVLAAKLAALRAHRTQLGSEHLLSTMPDEVASKLLSREYFVRLQAPGESADWLLEVTHLPTSEPLGGLYGR
jgi:N-acetyl-1-D-myo-inositol-2-amino-2-deoxy-alpha-D-glucopyranoside deacetylase